MKGNSGNMRRDESGDLARGDRRQRLEMKGDECEFVDGGEFTTRK
jgi:hypothetical protein